MLAERNEQWNMLGTLLDADDTDITQLTFGKEHLLCRLFKFRANFDIDDSSLMSLTKIILKNLLDLQDQNGQPLIEMERFNERNGSKGYRICITQPGKATRSRRVAARSVANLPGLVLPAGIKKSMMERLLLAVNKRQLQSRESI
ncbi:hypothetical protein [Endozoicomonas sp. YOMI1]|uniref:hypothetical protein n=1 Tax=Endozoicomonas sp. YOMI1 TaxID=2828739 RepID=UPI00214941B0|nr:hypothetical protein [Endozoicomonas sp. YOMI1]